MSSEASIADPPSTTPNPMKRLALQVGVGLAASAVTFGTYMQVSTTQENFRELTAAHDQQVETYRHDIDSELGILDPLTALRPEFSQPAIAALDRFAAETGVNIRSGKPVTVKSDRTTFISDRPISLSLAESAPGEIAAEAHGAVAGRYKDFFDVVDGISGRSTSVENKTAALKELADTLKPIAEAVQLRSPNVF